MELIYKGAFFLGGGGHPIYEHFNPRFDHKNQQLEQNVASGCMHPNCILRSPTRCYILNCKTGHAMFTIFTVNILIRSTETINRSYIYLSNQWLVEGPQTLTRPVKNMHFLRYAKLQMLIIETMEDTYLPS